ncbi:MAG: CDP-alcohol phosphatidyltransferase [Crocinitomicaceae bacterium]|nr:CDP-alcohol phosphatidyltransferase [Crocinitomicaceae bacterium]|tara:strand:- start:9773 stop:10369 length:597 start_codon:yes stop_codon:yes gene_type:complete
MISTYKIKPAFQKLLTPLLKVLRKLGLTPNLLSVLAILLSFFLGCLFSEADSNNTYYLYVTLGLLFRMMLNALDGMMARVYDLQSRTGEMLNEVGDIVSDVAIFYPLLFLEGLDFRLAFSFIVLSTINEFCGILGKAMGGERRYDGPMGKSDRATLVGVICLLFYFDTGVEPYLKYIFAIAIGLVSLSSVIRLKYSIK